jgi:SAM-dependent methyltransferase
MIAKAIRILRTRGVAGLAYAVNSRLQGLMAGQAKSFQSCKDLFVGKCGIEIGGPSRAFSVRGIFPVYPIVGSLDNCNFSDATVWEGSIREGNTFVFDRNRPAGRQHIVEATAMGRFASDSYDFVLASHVLEHVANPILALSEWKRLLREWGVLVLILPHKDRTFDHRRPVTSLEHLIRDLNAGTGEDDLTHLPEILALHDLDRDPGAGGDNEFRLRCMQNNRNRCLHHHAFDTSLVAEVAKYTGLDLIRIEEVRPFHILLVAQKTGHPSMNI